MKQTELQTRASMLEQKIAALPAGSIGTKTINGKTYFYHRWTEKKNAMRNTFLRRKSKPCVHRLNSESCWKKS